MANVPQMWSSHFRDLDHFRRDFDDLFDRMLGGGAPQRRAGSEMIAPPIETFVEKDNLIIRADLPGVDPKDVQVNLTGTELTIRGARESRTEGKERGYLHREVSYGQFERHIQLPEGVKPEQIKAAFRNGVLELTIPMPKIGAHTIPIEVESNGGAAIGEKKQ